MQPAHYLAQQDGETPEAAVVAHGDRHLTFFTNDDPVLSWLRYCAANIIAFDNHGGDHPIGDGRMER